MWGVRSISPRGDHFIFDAYGHKRLYKTKEDAENEAKRMNAAIDDASRTYVAARVY
jgi:hypothetical protein